MTNVVLNSARYSDLFKMATKNDILRPNNGSIDGIKYPVAVELLHATPLGTVTLDGGSAEYEIANSGDHLGEIFLPYTLTALTSGNYCANHGLAMIETLNITCGGYTILNVKKGENLVESVRHNLPNDVQTALLTMAGGATPASGPLVCPIITPWSRLSFGWNPHTPTIPLHLLGSNIRIKMTFKSSADQLAAGASGTAVFTYQPLLYYQNYITTQAQKDEEIINSSKWFMKCNLFDAIDPVTATTATDTTANITSFLNDYSEFIIFAKTVANYTTNQVYFTLSQISTRVKIEFDGKLLMDIYDGARDLTQFIDYYNLINSGQLVIDSNIVRIPFSYKSTPEEKYVGYYGGLKGDSVKTISITVHHTLGADALIFVLGIKHAILRIEKGKLMADLAREN